MFDYADIPDSGIFRGFEPDSFAFLAELRANNRRDWMALQEERYQRVLREPLRALFRALAPVAARLNPYFETDAKYGRLLSAIRRRWMHAGNPYNDHLWGAFYRSDRSRFTDAQLFVSLSADGCAVGLAIMPGATDMLVQATTRINARPDTFRTLIEPLLAHGFYLTTAQERLTVERLFAPTDDLMYRPEFADDVSALFEHLYPLYRFLISEDEALPPARHREGYTFEQLCADTLLPADLLRHMTTLLRDKGQIVLYGPPGTGKTFVARRLADHLIGIQGEIRAVQFHPSYGYEEFVEGIRPRTEGGSITYAVEPGVFRLLCDEARQRPDWTFVLLIDELNRGNVPRIFGELLYLLEYRDPGEAIILPYSKAPFSMPQNVLIVATMNAADRSLVTLDAAVRRRFHFVPLRPDPSLLRAWLVAHGKESLVWLADLLAELNRRLEEDGIDWQQQFGHTLWMLPTLDEARAALIWEHSVLPSLETLLFNRRDWSSRYDYERLKALVHAR